MARKSDGTIEAEQAQLDKQQITTLTRVIARLHQDKTELYEELTVAHMQIRQLQQGIADLSAYAPVEVQR